MPTYTKLLVCSSAIRCCWLKEIKSDQESTRKNDPFTLWMVDMVTLLVVMSLGLIGTVVF